MTHPNSDGFAHQRLDAYQIAQQLATEVVRMSRTVPRGFADLRDQVNRSALATVRHIAEGANRLTPADRRARYVIARGEIGECDATLDTLARLDFIPASCAEDLRCLAARVGAMLTGLIQREPPLLASQGGMGNPSSGTVSSASGPPVGPKTMS